MIAGAILALLALAAGAPVAGQKPQRAATKGVLHELNGAISSLIARVSPAVVQVLVTGYGPVAEGRPETGALIARQSSLGSGVIVDQSGYILTNSHVVHGAQRITVMLPTAGSESPSVKEAGKRRSYEATIVGTYREIDLALLKIDAAGLPTLPLRDDLQVLQGELVFAIGSPQGLESTVTMGVVSSARRQADLDRPMVFIQTDAPINPGNSGGPLVNADGELVGINTFILSQSGGSQGLGFAIPAAVARFVYDGLRKEGHVHRIEVGLSAQTIVPTLAAGLQLPRDWGVLVSDATLGGPARAAGVQEGDVIDTIDGHLIDTLATLTSTFYLHREGVPMSIRVLRGAERLTFQVKPVLAKTSADQLIDLASPTKDLVPRLGVLAINVDDKLRGLVQLRKGTGVIVAGRTLDATSIDSGLLPGDVIHAVNRAPIESTEALREAIGKAKSGDAVVLQIERGGLFHYLFFQME